MDWINSFIEIILYNVSFTEMDLKLSVTAQMWKLAFRITDYSFWKYDYHNNFHQKVSFLVSN